MSLQIKVSRIEYLLPPMVHLGLQPYQLRDPANQSLRVNLSTARWTSFIGVLQIDWWSFGTFPSSMMSENHSPGILDPLFHENMLARIKVDRSTAQQTGRPPGMKQGTLSIYHYVGNNLLRDGTFEVRFLSSSDRSSDQGTALGM